MDKKQKKYRSLFCLILVTALTISLVYAKYVQEVKINSQLGTTEVAKHHLYLTGDNSESIKLSNLNPGSKITILFSVSNGKDDLGDKKVSEVDMKYQLDVITTNHLPLKFTIKDDTDNKLQDPEEETMTMPYSNAGRHIVFHKDKAGRDLLFAMNVLEKHDYTLEVEWPIDENDFKYTKEVEQIFIEVVGEQAQPQ